MNEAHDSPGSRDSAPSTDVEVRWSRAVRARDIDALVEMIPEVTLSQASHDIPLLYRVESVLEDRALLRSPGASKLVAAICEHIGEQDAGWLAGLFEYKLKPDCFAPSDVDAIRYILSHLPEGTADWRDYAALPDVDSRWSEAIRARDIDALAEMISEVTLVPEFYDTPFLQRVESLLEERELLRSPGASRLVVAICYHIEEDDNPGALAGLLREKVNPEHFGPSDVDTIRLILNGLAEEYP